MQRFVLAASGLILAILPYLVVAVVSFIPFGKTLARGRAAKG